MLYDKRWDKPEIKADPFSLESLIAWLEKQPAEATYNYCEPSQCLLGKYVAANGGEYFGAHYQIGDQAQSAMSYGLGPLGDIVHGGPWTFGDALDRARKLLAERS